MRPIQPGRPELIYQAYLAEKKAWLAANPVVQLAQYRKKRGFNIWGKRWCLQHKKFLPRERLNIETEALVQGDPNWSLEELSAWLDWDKKKDEAIEQEVEAELIAAGGFGQNRERGIQPLFGRIQADSRAEERQYRFFY